MQSLLFLLWLLTLICSVAAIWPQPKRYTHGSSIFWLSPDVRFAYTPSGQTQPLEWLWKTVQKILPHSIQQSIPVQNESFRGLVLEPAFERMKHNILNRSFVPRMFHARNAEFEPAPNISRRYIEEMIITRDVQQDAGDEGYTLDIYEDGKVQIKVASQIGGLYAFETFTQLFFVHSTVPAGSYTPFAPLSIMDKPTFEHRGLNLDISRNWISPADVMRTIEGMSANRLNRLHLHASDSQSWPLEIPSLPELAIEGAYSPFQIWRTEDLEAVQRHGTNYGIEVYVEIDVPGHTTSIGNAFPQLVTAKDEPWVPYALEPPSGQLRLNSSEVPPFLDTLLNDLLSRTSQHSRFFHLGGDELNLNAYLLDPTVKSSSPQIIQPLIQTLIDQVISLATLFSLTVILWEEMLLDWNLTLPKNVIVQTWRGNQDQALSSILDKGHRALFGSNAYWYLDCGLGSFLDPEPSNANTPITQPYLDYCQPYKNWRHMYAYDPFVDVPKHQRHLVVGGEVHLWGELTDSVNLDGMLWPRVAAAAEVMWSGPESKPDETTTRRLAEMRERLLARGIRAGVVQMEWCLRHKGGCTL